jgi:hypothetical protein
MKDEIQALVNFFKLVTADELYVALSKNNPLRRKPFHKCLDSLEDQGAIIKVLEDENSLGVEGYIVGPNLSTDIKIDGKTFLLDCDIDRRNSADVYYHNLEKRLSKKLEDEVETLLKKTALVYEDPKKLEIDYFTLSLRYHELRGFFLNFEISAFDAVKLNLDECRKLLDNLEI